MDNPNNWFTDKVPDPSSLVKGVLLPWDSFSESWLLLKTPQYSPGAWGKQRTRGKVRVRMRGWLGPHVHSLYKIRPSRTLTARYSHFFKGNGLRFHLTRKCRNEITNCHHVSLTLYFFLRQVVERPLVLAQALWEKRGRYTLRMRQSVPQIRYVAYCCKIFSKLAIH